MFAQSREVHSDNSRFSPRRLQEEHWLLRGLARCGVCGRATACQGMRATNGTSHYYYTCQRNDILKDDDRCSQRRVRAEALDQFVWAEVRRHLVDPTTLTRGYMQAGVDGERLDEDALSVRLRHVERRKRELDKEETRLLDVYQAGLVDLTQFTRRHNILQEKRHSLEQEQHMLVTQQAMDGNQRTIADSLETFSRHIRARMRQLTFHQKQTLVRMIVDKVTVRDHHVAIYFKIPCDVSPSPPPRSPSQPGPITPVSTQFALRSTHLHVVIDINPRDLPFAIHERHRRQWTEDGLIEAFEELAPTRLIQAHRPAVQLVDELRDAGVEGLEGKERLMTQPGDDPSLGHQNSRFDFGFGQSSQIQVIHAIKQRFGLPTRFIHYADAHFDLSS